MTSAILNATTLGVLDVNIDRRAGVQSIRVPVAGFTVGAVQLVAGDGADTSSVITIGGSIDGQSVVALTTPASTTGSTNYLSPEISLTRYAFLHIYVSTNGSAGVFSPFVMLRSVG